MPSGGRFHKLFKEVIKTEVVLCALVENQRKDYN